MGSLLRTSTHLRHQSYCGNGDDDVLSASDSDTGCAYVIHTVDMRRWGLLLVGVAAVLGLSMYWFNGYVNKVQFFGYIQKYSHVPQPERTWLDEHHDLVLAEGRAYCDWLSQFPEVPEVVPSGEADVGKFRARYVRVTAASTELTVSDRARATVAAAAGAYFCHGTVDSRTSFSVPEEQL
jgi:hypothetical protein